MVKRALEAVAGHAAIGLLTLLQWTDPERLASFFASAMRRVGPWLPEHRVGHANLQAAYPDKSPEEIEAILREVWANLGRVGAEYVHFDKMWRYDPYNPAASRIEISAETLEDARIVRGDGKPGLLFTAHYGNWELCAVAVAQLGIDSLVLYRPPNNQRVAEAVSSRRAQMMGTLVPTRRDAIPTITKALAEGRHVSLVVDQHFAQGVDVTFFGRPCKANPTLARLARRFECPIYGARVVRLPGHRFRFESTGEITPVRDAEGKIDVQGTTQRINDVIETWVRDHPEQWLWLHRRWR
jgi:KDO2-lipid IV(A) lauroyltransferase